MKLRAKKINTEKTNLSFNAPTEISKRKGWSKAFKEMAANGHDGLIIPDIFEDEQIPEWEWQSDKK